MDGYSEGDLITLRKGEASITGRYKRITFHGFACEPMLVLDEDIMDGRNVEKMLELGWELTTNTLSVPAGHSAFVFTTPDVEEGDDE